MKTLLMQQKSILIYDDDTEILEITKLILSGEYQIVETLLNCKNLFQDIERVKPDLIIIDLWMPEMNGQDAIELLRMNDHTRKIPVLVFSAVNNVGKIAKEIHATGAIEKPFNINVLKETVKKYIL